MKIVTLVENETSDQKLKSVHGLSLYIEEGNHKILFDLGPNNFYLENAKKLGINLKEVDVVVISHGHYDHGNGIRKFMRLNKKAKIYISKYAFSKQYKFTGRAYHSIGIKKPRKSERVFLIDKDYIINDKLRIYSEVKYDTQLIFDNSLMTKREKIFTEDQFEHEIYLGISNEKHRVLFSGCSHKGIGTIIDAIETKNKISFTHIIGGFHLSHFDPENLLQITYLEQLGLKLLNSSKSNYYSCHCTGDEAFYSLKQTMHDKLERIKTGSIINI